MSRDNEILIHPYPSSSHASPVVNDGETTTNALIEIANQTYDGCTNMPSGNGTMQPTARNLFLYYVSYTGWVLSIASLLVTVATYLSLRTLRNKTTSRILICLSASLLCLYIVFASGVQKTNDTNDVTCNVVAALLHYFTLTSVAWMSVESYAVYSWIKRGRKSRGTKFFIKCCLVAWGLPFVLIGIIGLIDPDQYNTSDNKNICFMATPKNSGKTLKEYWAFIFFNLELIFFIISSNFLFLTVVAKELLFGRDFAPRYGDRDHDKKRKQAIVRTVNDLVMSVLLVFTWIFGTISNVYPCRDNISYAFAMLFCLCYFLQGFLVFLLFCVRLEEVRILWKECIVRVTEFIKYIKEPLYVLLFIAVTYIALDMMKIGEVFDTVKHESEKVTTSPP